MIMIANEVIPENSIVVRKLWEIHPYKPVIEGRTALLDGRFIEANLGKRTTIKFSGMSLFEIITTSEIEYQHWV